MSVAARWLRLWPQGSQPNAPAGSVAIVAWQFKTSQGVGVLGFVALKHGEIFPKPWGWDIYLYLNG